MTMAGPGSLLYMPSIRGIALNHTSIPMFTAKSNTHSGTFRAMPASRRNRYALVMASLARSRLATITPPPLPLQAGQQFQQLVDVLGPHGAELAGSQLVAEAGWIASLTF